MLKLDAGLHLEPGASPNVLFKFIGQIVHIWGDPSRGTVLYSYKYNNQTNHQVNNFPQYKKHKSFCAGYATVNNFIAVERPHAAPHTHYNLPVIKQTHIIHFMSITSLLKLL